MLRLVLLPALSLVLAQTSARPSGTAEAPASPRLRVDPPGRQDLGSVGPRQVVSKLYAFRNISDAPIRLRLLDLSPGLAARGSALEAPIPPQAEARLEVTVDPTGFVHEQKRSIRLGTDDPRQGNYYLPIALTVRPDLTVDGLKKSFGILEPHESPRISFAFARETGEPAGVRLGTPMPAYLEAEVRPAGSKAELHLTFRPERVEPGVERGLEHIRVETNAPLQPSFDLYVDWRLRHPIEAIPVRMVCQDPGVRRQTILLKARDGRPFRIVDARVIGNGFVLEPRDGLEAATHTLSIGRTAKTSARALLVITIPDQAPVRIPLVFLPPPPKSMPPKG